MGSRFSEVFLDLNNPFSFDSKQKGNIHYIPGPSSLGVPGVPWHTQYSADQLTLFQPGGQIMPTTLLLAYPDLKTYRHLWFNEIYEQEFLIIARISQTRGTSILGEVRHV